MIESIISNQRNNSPKNNKENFKKTDGRDILRQRKLWNVVDWQEVHKFISKFILLNDLCGMWSM